MSERDANWWYRSIGLASVAAIVVFIAMSSLRIQEKLVDLKGDISKRDQAIIEMRSHLDQLVTRLEVQQLQEIEHLCIAGHGRFDSNRFICTFDNGRPSLKFTSLAP
jgi:hypothetical protein